MARFNWQRFKGAYGAYYCPCGVSYNAPASLRRHLAAAPTCAALAGYERPAPPPRTRHNPHTRSGALPRGGAHA